MQSRCKNSKVAGLQIFRKKTEREVIADSYNLIALPKSPVSLSRGDEVPHIFTRKPRPRPAEFSVTSAKRLLQQNRPEGEVLRCVSNVCSRGNCRRDVLALGTRSKH
jgi:hypothetical protein